MDPVEDKFFARGPEKSNEVARNTNLTFGIFPPRQHFILWVYALDFSRMLVAI